MLTIADAEDAFLGGHADFQAWQEKFTTQWYAPLMSTMLGALWMSLSPEEHAALQAMSPEGYNQVDQMIGGKNASTLHR